MLRKVDTVYGSVETAETGRVLIEVPLSQFMGQISTMVEISAMWEKPLSTVRKMVVGGKFGTVVRSGTTYLIGLGNVVLVWGEPKHSVSSVRRGRAK